MPLLLFRKSLLVVCFFLAPCAVAQISEYGDCSEHYHDKSTFERPSTQEEKAERLEDIFYDRLSSVTKCVDQNSDGSGGGGSASGGGSSGGGSSGGGAGQSMSRNTLSEGEKSLGITGTEVQVPVAYAGATPTDVEADLTNGREHKELEVVDNKAALRAQIKAQADIETDPEIKAKLIEQYEALK